MQDHVLAEAGNEIDRSQVYAFASHMQALAMAAGGSVTVLSHPSLSGIASGSGISGSKTNCAKATTITLTILAGPLDYAGANPNIKACHVPRPSK